MEMQKAVEFAEVEKEKIRFARLHVAARTTHNLLVRAAVVGIRAIGDALFGQTIEDGRRARDASRLINVVFFDPVEPRQQPRGHAAFEEWAKPQHAPAHLLDDSAADAIRQQTVRQRAEVTEPAKRRALGIVVEQIPVAGYRRRRAGQDRGDRAGAESQHGAHRCPVGEQVLKKAAILDDPPSQTVDEHEDMKRGLTVHAPPGRH